MAKKKSYDVYLRQQIGDLIDQLQLPGLYKQALKERWLDQMIWADKKATESRRLYYRLRLLTIVGGVILPALVGISVQLGQDSQFFRVWFPPLTFALSQVIAVSVAVEEFCKFGDRWRDYRKMAEDLKSEGWQYIQSSGPYEYGVTHLPDGLPTNGASNGLRLEESSPRFDPFLAEAANFQLNGEKKHRKTHLENYAHFASRIESIIKNDVQSYISDLLQQQVKQDVEVQKALAHAQAVTSDKKLIQQITQLDSGYPQPAPAAPISPAAMMAAIASGSSEIATSGLLRVQQDTVFKLTPQPSQTLPLTQKVTIAKGSAFGLLSYTVADQNHLYVTLNQGLGTENRNGWFVYAPHVEILDPNGQPIALAPAQSVPMAQPGTVAVAAIAQPSIAPPPTTPSNGVIKLPVPYFSQRDNQVDAWRTCNTSSCAMVAKYLGAKISGDDEYYQYVIKYGDTTDHTAQTQALNELGIKSTWNTNLDFEDLDKSLASGLPIVVGILHRGPLEAPTGGGHILVIIGRTASGDYIVHDPYGSVLDGYVTTNGKGLVYPRPVLVRRWTPEGKGSGWGRLFYGNAVPAGVAGSGNIQQWTPATTSTAPSPNLSAIRHSLLASPIQEGVLITADQLIQIAGSYAAKDRLRELAPAMNQTLVKYEINTPRRIAHFIAQLAHESDRFRAMAEYASGEAYENREDLGNTEPGDGKRFKGRGLIQLTGRANYRQFSQAVGEDFVANPTKLEQLPYCVLAAGWFWHDRNLNPLADQDDVVAITRRINGGTNGLEDRKDFLQKAKAVLNC